jgi:LCP family protein required for cell wall assembly
MNRPIIIILALLLLVTSCAPFEPSAPYSPYYFVTVGPDATATPTPFQPYVPVTHTGPQPGQLALGSPTLLPPPITATPLPTATLLPTAQPTPEVVTQPQPVIEDPEIVTFLLLGSDTRGGTSFRTDTILIAIVRPRDGQVSLISVPRDLWVNIPTVGMQRINTAYLFGQNSYQGGGAGLLKDTILYNLGLKIDHIAMIDFNGFRKVVDTFGGIDVPISCPYTDWRLLDPSYDPENENNWFLYTAGPGLLHMDGDLALWYARSRKRSNDFDRGRRQQEVIRAIYKQALRTDSVARIPQLYTDLSSLFTTDLGLADILKLAPMGLHLSNADIRSYYIAGSLVTSWITPGGAYVLLPNNELIQQMLNQAISASPVQQERKTASIEIQNGSPTDGWDALAAERLNYAGYQTIIGAADNRSHATTLLYDLTPDQDHNHAAAILAVLGLPDTALVSLPSPGSKTSYALIVGTDYKACFDPAGLTP